MLVLVLTLKVARRTIGNARFTDQDGAAHEGDTVRVRPRRKRGVGTLVWERGWHGVTSNRS